MYLVIYRWARLFCKWRRSQRDETFRNLACTKDFVVHGAEAEISVFLMLCIACTHRHSHQKRCITFTHQAIDNSTESRIYTRGGELSIALS